MPFKESRGRSIIKALTFRAAVICFDLTLIFLWTREWDKTLYMTLLSNLIRLMLYYGHERLWNRIGHGKEVNIVKLQDKLNVCQHDLAELKHELAE